jgi:hypothetical protein
MCRIVERIVSINITPIKSVNIAEPTNTCQSEFPDAASAIAGIHMATAKVDMRMPVMNNMGLKSNTGSELPS